MDAYHENLAPSTRVSVATCEVWKTKMQNQMSVSKVLLSMSRTALHRYMLLLRQGKPL